MNKVFSHIFKRMRSSEKRMWLDALILAMAFLVTYWFLDKNGLAARVSDFSKEHPSLSIDTLLLTLAITAVYLIAYIIRRQTYLRFKIRQANTDSLVGVYNRRKGTELLQEEIQRANLHRVPFSLVMFDIDNFKKINDKHGHDRGDQVLKEVIHLAQQHSRSTDILVRWGGEEFVIGCCGIGLDVAKKLADRIRHAIAEHDFSIQDRVTASFGATDYQLCEELDELVKRADNLLYKSKKAGKNQVWSVLDLDDEEDIILQ